MPAEKRHPYAHLSDQELDQLAAEAADLRFKIAALSPGEVAQTLREHGCPPASVTRMVTDPLLRQGAVRFHLDVADARLGDREATARVERVTEAWRRLREREGRAAPA